MKTLFYFQGWLHGTAAHGPALHHASLWSFLNRFVEDKAQALTESSAVKLVKLLALHWGTLMSIQDSVTNSPALYMNTE